MYMLFEKSLVHKLVDYYSVPPHNMVASLKIIRKFISKL